MTKLEFAKMMNVTLEQVDAQYAANAEGFREMYNKAKQTGKKVGGYTANQLHKQWKYYTFLANTDFKIGDRVSYTLVDQPLFTGTITDIDPDPKNKPYIILSDTGSVQFATSDYLKKI